jgi:hypothetical protein
MKKLTYTKAHNLGALNDELLAIPALQPTPTGQDGRDEAVMSLSGNGQQIELWVPDDAPEPDIDAVIAAHTNPPVPPAVIEYAEQRAVEAMLRTTDDQAHEVFRFPCQARSVYRANLRITGIDAQSGATKIMEGRFGWKRPTTTAVMVGVTVVSDIADAAAASWQPSAVAQGTDIVFTVKGAAGRTIDWLLVGELGRYAPEGLEAS